MRDGFPFRARARVANDTLYGIVSVDAQLFTKRLLKKTSCTQRMESKVPYMMIYKQPGYLLNLGRSQTGRTASCKICNHEKVFVNIFNVIVDGSCLQKR
jgi:hypothetical protein